ncbi:transcriptional regulator [Salinicola endophyticus]|uniref:transcriptional regulator n=1 Tax=Salinicola endophyticus TaxID=1949083 RepID=UPI00165FE7D7|nr:transcriptional regulator [Salinicola endophyticus]
MRELVQVVKRSGYLIPLKHKVKSEDMDLGKAIDQILAENAGETLEKYRAQRLLFQKLSRESEKYIDTHSLEWPPIKFNWDLSRESQRHSLDSASPKKFAEYYPAGFLLGFITLQELDKKLCHYSRRDEGELWEVGSKDKLARLIVYLSEGWPISPPLVKPLENCEVIFNGGHHRYAIAKEIGVDIIPIHIQPEYQERIDEILRIRWEDA